jgi:hypothetical protein
MTARWLRRAAEIVALGILFAIVVTEIELAAGVDLLDAPFFHSPPLAFALGLVALGFAAWQARPTTTAAGMAAGVLAFGIVVLPFNALAERPAMPVDFWKGNTGLLLDRTMTVDRPHSVVLLSKGAQQVSNTAGGQVGARDARDVLGADAVVARLSGEPPAAFTVVPDKDQPQTISLAADMRWAWVVTPRQQGPQRLVLRLDSLAKNSGKDAVSSLYRQLVVITVQAPSWYEVGRKWLTDLVSGA